MTAQTQIDSESSEAVGLHVRRRSLIAGAGALIAGMVAMKTARPVGATDGSALIVGQTNSTVSQTTLTGDFSPPSKGNQPMFLVTNTSQHGSAINGITTDGTGYGVFAVSALGTGLYGGVAAAGGSNSLAILGENLGQGDGIHGTAGSGDSATGVLGSSTGALGNGVKGTSPNIGVNGQGGFIGVLGGSSQAQGAGVYGGTDQPTGSGVYGQGLNGGTAVSGGSDSGYGVQGTSTKLHGVVGMSGTDAGASGVIAIGTAPGTVGFQGVAQGGATYAGYFFGAVSIQGSLGVTGSKFAVVKGVDGTYRGMYAVESPECWFEDFGTATLVGGQANITLDPLFAQHIDTGSYLVFLTPHGESKGLFVAGKTANGFAVQEQQGGTSGVTFCWRAIGKRADIKGERLPVWEVPAQPTFTGPAKPPATPAPQPAPQPRPVTITAPSVSSSASSPSVPQSRPASSPVTSPQGSGQAPVSPAPLPTPRQG